MSETNEQTLQRALAKATAKRDEAALLLREVEWAGDSVHFVCPICQCSRPHGHKADCRLDAFFRELWA